MGHPGCFCGWATRPPGDFHEREFAPKAGLIEGHRSAQFPSNRREGVSFSMHVCSKFRWLRKRSFVSRRPTFQRRDVRPRPSVAGYRRPLCFALMRVIRWQDFYRAAGRRAGALSSGEPQQVDTAGCLVTGAKDLVDSELVVAIVQRLGCGWRGPVCSITR
jgi:hypothetical protein